MARFMVPASQSSSQTVPMTTSRHLLIALPCCHALFSLIIFSIKDAFFLEAEVVPCVCVCQREALNS